MFQKRTRYICRCNSQQSIDNYSYPLLPLITSNFPNYPLEASINNPYHLAYLEFMDIRRHNDNILCFGCTNDFETLHLPIRNDERFFNNTCSLMEMAIIKAEVGEVYVIVNERLNLFFRPARKKDIGKP